jgi:hypothetical protein
MTDKVGRISASSIAAFKACPQRYRIAYVEGLRVAQEPQPLRMGTAWHKGLEVLSAPEGTISGDIGPGNAPPVRITNENRLEIAVELATDVYTTVPDWADATEWAVEREIVACGLAAYSWLYPPGSSEYETVATELEFDLPLVNPETGRPTPSFRRVGKIDRIIRHKGNGRLLIQENKSTSKSIDSDSTYWLRLRKDTQSKVYIVAARNMNLPQGQPSGLLHDVFHKPQISPKKLTQAESAEFVKTGEYCGQSFAVGRLNVGGVGDQPVVAYLVDGVEAQIELGAEPKPKKDGTCAPRAFAIRETPGMFGARLLQDMTTRPEFYFARQEIAFTDQELKAFEYQVWALQKNMAEMERTGFWFENEGSCETTWKCPFCSLCYNNVDVFNGQTPPGFKRLHAEQAEQTQVEGE